MESSFLIYILSSTGFVARHQAQAWTLTPALDYAGCLLFEMLTGTAPFGDSDTNSKFEIFNNITAGHVPYPWRIPGALKRLIGGILQPDPAKRFTYRKVLQSGPAYRPADGEGRAASPVAALDPALQQALHRRALPAVGPDPACCCG